VNGYFSVFCHGGARLVDAFGVHKYFASENHGLGFLGSFSEIATNEKLIEADAHFFRFHREKNQARR
jgi:hypothetical protein